jgi:predicted DNA-binding ribbon-helix-helix protein
MKSTITKHSIVVAGRRTSVSLEYAFWDALKEIARKRGLTLSELISAIDACKQHGNLSSALRLFVLGVFRDQVSAPQPDHQGRNGQVPRGDQVLRNHQRVLRV